MEILKMNPVYFSAAEAAQLLGLSRQRLGVLLRSKRIQGAFNAGKHVGWQIPKASILTPIKAVFGAYGRVGTKTPQDSIQPGERRKPGRPRKSLTVSS